MTKKIIISSTFSKAFKDALTIIKNRAIDLSKKHILIVPDKYTLFAEQQLFLDQGAFDVEVMTFNRLFLKLCDKTGYLSKEGAIMLLSGIIERLDLDCYKKAAKYRGFCEKIYDTICQFKACLIQPQQIIADNELNFKLSDIRKIYEEYNLVTKDKFIDAGGRLDKLKDFIESDTYFDSSYIYITGFDDFTLQQEAIINALELKAAGIAIILTDKEYPLITGRGVAFDCPSGARQVKACAVDILNSVRNGLRFRDIAVVCPNENYRTLKRILTEFDIAYWLDEKFDLKNHPFSQFLFSVLNIYQNNFLRKDVLTLVKNPYMAVSKANSDNFELFCMRYNIEFGRFNNDFTVLSSDPMSFKAEEVRKKVVDTYNKIFNLIKPEMLGIEFLSAIESFIEQYYNNFNFDKYYEVYPFAASDVKGYILGILQTISDIVTFKAPAKTLIRMLVEGMSASQISLLPNLSDSVTIGEPEIFRGQNYKKLYVLDFNEGAIPEIKYDLGIITDDEIDGLEFKLAPKIKEINQRKRLEIYMLLSACNEFFLCYDSSSQAGPSNILLSLIEQGIVNRKSYVNSLAYLYEKKESIIDAAGCKNNSLEIFVKNTFDFYRNEDLYPFQGELYKTLEEHMEKDLFTTKSNKLNSNTAQNLFLSSGLLSVSKLQAFFMCPFMFFIKYGLKAKERESGKFEPVDVGKLLHHIVENYVKKYLGSMGDEKIIDMLLEKALLSNPKQHVIEACLKGFLKKEALVVCKIIDSHLNKGLFNPLGEEIVFGDKLSDYKTLTFNYKGRELFLKGAIDYADVYEGYARIIDYKTGDAKFNYKDIFYGLKIQLPLYTKVLEINGYKTGGFFYFPFSIKWDDDEFSHKLLGCFDKNLVYALDNLAYQKTGKSTVINAEIMLKDGEKAIKPHNNYALDAVDIAGIKNYAVRLIYSAIDDIYEGLIIPSPFKSGQKTPCNFCDYINICGFKKDTGNYRELKSKKVTDFLEAVNDLDS